MTCQCGAETGDECAQCGEPVCWQCLLMAFGLVLCTRCEAGEDVVPERGSESGAA
jgi:hypothetical protein